MDRMKILATDPPPDDIIPDFNDYEPISIKMTMAEFLSDTKQGFFQHGHGIAFYGNRDGRSNIELTFHDIEHNFIDYSFTHVYWFDKKKDAICP